jgi:hypothetical protein
LTQLSDVFDFWPTVKRHPRKLTSCLCHGFHVVGKHVVTSGSTPSVIQTDAFHDRVSWLSCCGTGPIRLKSVAAFRTPGLHKFDYSQEIVDILQMHFGRNPLHLPRQKIKTQPSVRFGTCFSPEQ